MLSPETEAIWQFVYKFNFPWSLSSLTFWTLDSAPLKPSLLWIKFTLDVLDNSIAQSNAESPPPNIETVLSLKIDLSLIE